jgi:hypothetical protein
MMIRKLRPPLGSLALCVALIAALAGCGGGDDGNSGSQALSQEDFVSQANAACEQAQSDEATLPRPTDLAGFATYAEQLQPIAEEAISKLSALTPPSDLQAQFDQYLDDQRTAAAKLEDLKAAALAGDKQQAQAISDEIDALPDNSEATAMGLSVCAES